MGPGSGTQSGDDPSLTGGLSTLAACGLICTCTMHLVQSCDIPACYSGPGNGWPAQEQGQKSNKVGQGGNCPGPTRLPTGDQTARLVPDCSTAALADEQDRPSELAVVIPRSHRRTRPCSHIHTHARPLWRVRWRDVKNTTLGLLVPEHRQGSDPVPCMWKDEPG